LLSSTLPHTIIRDANFRLQLKAQRLPLIPHAGQKLTASGRAGGMKACSLNDDYSFQERGADCLEFAEGKRNWTIFARLRRRCVAAGDVEPA